SRRRHTRSKRDWSSDVCSSDLDLFGLDEIVSHHLSLESCRPPVWIGRSSPGDEPGKFSGVYLFGLHLRFPAAAKARLRTVRRGRSEERRVGNGGRGGGADEEGR